MPKQEKMSISTCVRKQFIPQCDGEVPLRCQQELHIQGILGVPKGRNAEDSNVARVDAEQ
jgi:hypothetical protein